MFSTMHKTAALALTATLFAGATPAQSLDAEIVRNPDDTVTYVFDIDGPPQGFVQMFLSTAFAQQPFQVFPYGEIYLDPLGILPLGPLLPLDDQGHCNFQIQVSTEATLDLPLVFQAVNIDAAFNIRLSVNAVALAQAVFAAPVMPAPVIPFNYTFAYTTGGSELRMAGSGKPGSVVEVRIVDSNGTRVTKKATIGADGKFTLNVTVTDGITTDDDVVVIHEGKLVDTIDLYKFK